MNTQINEHFVSLDKNIADEGDAMAAEVMTHTINMVGNMVGLGSLFFHTAEESATARLADVGGPTEVVTYRVTLERVDPNQPRRLSVG